MEQNQELRGGEGSRIRGLLSYVNFLTKKSGSGKGVLWKRGLFRKVHFLEILENLEILEILENPQTVETKGESDHFLENLARDFRDSGDFTSEKRPLS